MRVHPSHKTRFSDASTFDEICVNCGATDAWGGGLDSECSSPKAKESALDKFIRKVDKKEALPEE